MEPVLAFPSGLYLNGDVVSQANLQPFVAAAMNELEFLMGDSSTTYGAKRIALGYAKPFPIKYVEVCTSLLDLHKASNKIWGRSGTRIT